MTPTGSRNAQEVAHAAPKMVKSIDKSIKDHLAAHHEQTDDQKMLTKKHNDEKLASTLLIVGPGLIAHHFW